MREVQINLENRPFRSSLQDNSLFFLHPWKKKYYSGLLDNYHLRHRVVHHRSYSESIDLRANNYYLCSKRIIHDY